MSSVEPLLKCVTQDRRKRDFFSVLTRVVQAGLCKGVSLVSLVLIDDILEAELQWQKDYWGLGFAIPIPADAKNLASLLEYYHRTTRAHGLRSTLSGEYDPHGRTSRAELPRSIRIYGGQMRCAHFIRVANKEVRVLASTRVHGRQRDQGRHTPVYGPCNRLRCHPDRAIEEGRTVDRRRASKASRWRPQSVGAWLHGARDNYTNNEEYRPRLEGYMDGLYGKCVAGGYPWSSEPSAP